MKYTFTPRGVCAVQIDLEVEDGVVLNVSFTGGVTAMQRGLQALSAEERRKRSLRLWREPAVGINRPPVRTSSPVR